MGYAKDVLFAIQQNEKKYQQDKMEVTHDPLLKEYIQYLKNKNDEAVKSLTLCKTFLLKLVEDQIIPIETKVSIKELIRTL